MKTWWKQLWCRHKNLTFFKQDWEHFAPPLHAWYGCYNSGDTKAKCDHCGLVRCVIDV